MNRQDASELGQKFKRTWNGGPSVDIWAEELEPLHTNQANAAYEKLRRTEEHAPTIAKFFAVYHALTRPEDKPARNCGRCENSGWVEQQPVRHHRECKGPEFCHCSAVHPCDCAAGRDVTAAYRSIVGAKDSAA